MGKKNSTIPPLPHLLFRGFTFPLLPSELKKNELILTVRVTMAVKAGINN